MWNSSKDVSIISPTNDGRIKGKKKHRGCFTIIREFSLNTSAHGLPGIARSESVHNRIYWSVVLLGFTGFMIYLIVQAVREYFDYPTQMDFSIDAEWPQYFPAFSFCNVGGLRSDLFLRALLNYTNSWNLTNTNNISELLPGQLSSASNFVRDTINGNQSMAPYFFSLSSMLYYCSYNSVPCTAADFIPFVTSTYGLCFTFNAKLKNTTYESVRYGSQDGGSGRLELGLYVHSHLYVPYIVDSKYEEYYYNKSFEIVFDY